jgi:hypothetical protein
MYFVCVCERERERMSDFFIYEKFSFAFFLYCSYQLNIIYILLFYNTVVNQVL